MKASWKAIGVAFLVSGIITLLGVLFFFKPIAAADSGSGLVPPPFIAFLVYVGLCVALFDWAARQM